MSSNCDECGKEVPLIPKGIMKERLMCGPGWSKAPKYKSWQRFSGHVECGKIWSERTRLEIDEFFEEMREKTDE